MCLFMHEKGGFFLLVAKLTVHTGPLPAQQLCTDSSCFESRTRTHPWERTYLGFPCCPITDSHYQTRAGHMGTPMNTVDSGLWVEATLPRNLLRSFFFRTLKAGWRITAFGLVFCFLFFFLFPGCILKDNFYFVCFLFGCLFYLHFKKFL